MKKITFLFITILALSIGSLFAQHYKKDGTPDRRFKENRSSSYLWKTTTTTAPKHYKTVRYSYVASRDAHGKIKRSETAKYTFLKQTHYSHGRPGYVIDHIIPLKKGGCDCPSNMQWQTKAAARAKDKWE